MNAMILAAGFGTRLLPHTKRLPKPLFPVVDRTLLQIAIETVLKANPDRIVVNTHHLAGQIDEYLEKRDFGIEIKISREEEILGTAGGIKRAEKWLAGEDFAVINCDIIADVDWEGLTSAHKTKNAMATLALRSDPDPGRYSPVCMDADGVITRIGSARGPGYTQAQAPMMFTGVTVMSPSLLAAIPAGGFADIVKDVYSPVIAKGGALYGARVKWGWTDVGTAADYHGAVMEALRSREITPAAMWGDLHGVSVEPPVYIETGAVVERGARLGPCVAVHAGARVMAGAVLKNCVVLPGSIVEAGGYIEGEVI